MKAIVKVALNFIGDVQVFITIQIQNAMLRKQSQIHTLFVLNLKEI